MATIAKLMVELGLEGGAFDKGISSARKSLDDLGSSARKRGGILTAGVTLPIVGAGTALVNWASNLDESINKADKLFGNNADAVLAWSKTGATAMGLSQQATLDYASSFAGMFKSIADGPDQLMDMSMAMTQLTSDFGSFHNLNPEEAFTVISSALAGETEAIRRYGVDVSAAAVEQKAMEMGLAATTGELTEQDKALARYQIILDETTDAQGDFADTADSTSNRMKTFKARLQDVGSTFGRYLLPYVNQGLEALESLLNRLDKLSPSTQKWIVGIAAAAAALGPLLLIIGMLLPGLSALLAIIGFIASPIGLLIAAVAALILYFTDFGAVVEFLGKVLGPVVDFLKDLYEHFNKLIHPISSVMEQINKIGGLESPKGLSIWEAAIATLRYAFERLAAALLSIDWGAAFAAIGTAWSNIDWAGMLSALGSLTIALAGWLYDQATAVDWGGVLSTAAATAGDITSAIVSKLGDLTAALVVWVWTAADSVPWGDLISAAAAKVGTVVESIITAIGDLGAGLKTWYDNAIESVNWGGLGETVGAKIGDLSRTLAPKAGELIQGFLTAVVSPGLWAGIGSALLTMILALPVTIGYLGMTLAPKALEFLQGFVTGLDINWYTVVMWMALIPVKLLAAVGSLATTLVAKGTELLTGFYNGIVAGWPLAGLYLMLLGQKALAAVPSLTQTLWQKGMDIIHGFRSGMIDKWMEVITYLANRGPQAVQHIGALGTTLVGKGRDLITGFLVGVTAKWLDVSSFLSSIPGKAVSAVGSLGSVLYSAGASLLQGLMDGISDKIGALETLLGSVTSMIPDWKGPPERDAKLLVNNGRLIMGGLSRGLDDGWQDVTRQLSSYVPEINGMGDGSLGGGSGQVVQIITLEPGKWKEFLDNAMAGGSFAANFGPELAMYGGKP